MKIKKTYLCRNIIDFEIDKNIPDDYHPKVGDVGLFQIVKIGKHRSVQSEWIRNTTILPGDFIMAAFGNRYATNQFEGYVPEQITESMHILAAGGVVGQVKSMHKSFEAVGPTTISMVGVIRNKRGKIINTISDKRDQVIPFSGHAAAQTKVILSLGSSMDSGKTTTAANLINGIRKAGHSVAFFKLTGTAFTKDVDLNFDFGAEESFDFSELGYPSTYMCSEREILDIYETLLNRVMPCTPEYVIVEIADGLYQRETQMLYKNKRFMATIHAVIFSAGDSLAALHGCELLKAENIIPMALSGLFTASPLLINEVNEHKKNDIPVVNLVELVENASALVKRNLRTPAYS